MHARRVRSESIHHLRLATRDGEHLQHIPAITEPEAEMHITFEGLSEAEQIKALAAFPGGSRFTLVRDRKAG